MKRSEIIFNVVAVPLDACMLLLAGVAAFHSRLKLTDLVGPVIYNLRLGEFLWVAFPAIFVLLLVFAVLGLYNLRGPRKIGPELIKVVLGVSAGLFALVILFFFDHNLFPSRFIILASWIFGIIFVSLGRSALKFLEQIVYKRGKGLHRVVLINGHGQSARHLENEYKNSTFGYSVVKEFNFSANLISLLEDLSLKVSFDEVLQANASVSDVENLKILEWCRGKGLAFSFVPNFFQVQQRTIEIQTIAGAPLIRIKNTPLDGWGKVSKRVLDVFGSGCAMLILSPVYLATFLAIKLSSPGPAIYPQIRGGKDKDFWFYKFRSMYAHMSDGLGGKQADDLRAELWKKNDRGGASSPFLKIKNDPRVTHVGKFIRKTKLDEIPQFWNVLKGDMSLVGPRAHMITEVNLYRDKYKRVFSIKPGIFGISQLEQIKWPDLPFEEEMRLCTYYIENWSLWLDIKILFKSAYLIFFGKRSKEDY